MSAAEKEIDKRIYFFEEGSSEGNPAQSNLLGGKGAGLAAMCRAGLPVPPGFTLSVDCCAVYLETGQWPEGLHDQLKASMGRLETVTDRSFGQSIRPLLVSVRSGAARSMPGMMDTLLNVGLHPGLADVLSDKESFWSAYAQFVKMFAKIVADIPDADFEQIASTVSTGQEKDKRLSEAYRAAYETKTGKRFPATSWDTLLECVEAVFRSWNSERAVVYRRHNDIRGLAGTAVTVQAMFPSEISGIGFTANPTDPSANVIILEAAYGLGEAVVSGEVTPDRFVLDRESLAIRDESIGHKAHVVTAMGDNAERDPDSRSLTNEQIHELGRIALRIEAHFGFPVDFEWGWADGQFALLQARAIRDLDIAQDVEVGRVAERERLKTLAGTERKVWVIHNLSETLSAPTPLTWDIVRAFMTGDGGFGLMYQDFGYQPTREVKQDGFLELITGRIYADPDRAANLFWEGMPLDYNLDAIVADPNILAGAPTQFSADKTDGRFLLRLPFILVGMIRASRRMKRARANAIPEFERTLGPYRTYVDEKRKQDLAELSVDQVLAEVNERRKRVLNDFGKESLKPGFFGGLAYGKLEAMLVQLMGQEKGAALCAVLTSGIEGDSTVEQNIALHNVAHQKASLESFVEEYGHRTVSEMELMQPRWREDPSYLERMMNMLTHPSAKSPETLHAANQDRRKDEENKLLSALETWGGSSKHEEIVDLMREVQRLLPYREIGKHYLMMGYEIIRLAILELARRWELGRDIFFLHLDELADFETNRPALEKKIAERRIRWRSAQRLDYSRVVDSQDLERLGLGSEEDEAASISDGAPRTYKADVLASGVFTGRARIVFDPGSTGDLGPDCILVCPSTDPGWTALFACIKGLIVERGGALSHGAITARDFGIPAVAYPEATKHIPEGARVRVDGNRGNISVLED